MNKITLLFFFILSSFLSFSQCSPLPNYADSAFGVWPDTIQNLPHAQKDVAYNTILHLKTPSSTSELGAPLSFSIDSLLIDDIEGLPVGYYYMCDNFPCSWSGGDIGCIEIAGTTSNAGTFVLDIKTRGYAGGGLFNSPYTFSGYKLIVDGTTHVIEQIALFTVFQNSPNPFTDNTTIQYQNDKVEIVTLEIYNILGEKLYANEQQSSVGTNTFRVVTKLAAGNYVYRISTPTLSITKKMLVSQPN